MSKIIMPNLSHSYIRCRFNDYPELCTKDVSSQGAHVVLAVLAILTHHTTHLRKHMEQICVEQNRCVGTACPPNHHYNGSMDTIALSDPRHHTYT